MFPAPLVNFKLEEQDIRDLEFNSRRGPLAGPLAWVISILYFVVSFAIRGLTKAILKRTKKYKVDPRVRYWDIAEVQPATYFNCNALHVLRQRKEKEEIEA